MFCTKCGAKFEEGNENCVQCGEAVQKHEATPGPVPTANNQGITVTLPPVKLPDKSQFRSFLNFDTMITPVIMKAIYIIGSIVIVLVTLFIMFSGFSSSFGTGVLTFFLGFIGGIVSLVLYRVFCEQVLLFFIMNQKLSDIRENTK